ncbi:MAG: DUF3997 domain-containing protein [Clostridia bacterium]|nr:DUF3997 domain-containing protein [Clostridia bacterium]
MRLLYLILRPDTLWGRFILVLLLLTVLFFLPAVIIHRHKIRQVIAQRKQIVIGLFVLLMMLLFIQIDFNLIDAYSFAKKYGWEIHEVRPVHKTMFKDGSLLNEENTQSLANENIQVYSINDPRGMAALICSDTIGLPYDQFLNKKVKLYSLDVKEEISFSHEGKVFTPDIDLKIGFINNEIVFGTLFIRSEVGSLYCPVNFNEESIKEEILKIYEDSRYVPAYGDVRISFLPGGHQLYYYPYRIIFPVEDVSLEDLKPVIPEGIFKVGFDNRYIIALQNEATADLRAPDIPVEKYYILDTEEKIVYEYNTLEEFENQCRQLRIDNIEFHAVDSFAVRSYARFGI